MFSLSLSLSPCCRATLPSALSLFDYATPPTLLLVAALLLHRSAVRRHLRHSRNAQTLHLRQLLLLFVARSFFLRLSPALRLRVQPPTDSCRLIPCCLLHYLSQSLTLNFLFPPLSLSYSLSFSLCFCSAEILPWARH